MRKDITPAGNVAAGIEVAWENMAVSFERFCLTAGVATLIEMMERDATEMCGPRHGRAAAIGVVIAGDAPRASSGSTAARWISSGPGFVRAAGPKWRCRGGRWRKPRT